MLRVVVDGYRDPIYNMALDEAILRLRSRVGFDTLRVYMWRPSGVSIGRSQDFFSALNLQCISRLGFTPVRRPTGGGALLHREGYEVTYSVVLSSRHPLYSLDVASSAVEIAKGVLGALSRLGVEPSISGSYVPSDTPLCYFRRGSSDVLIGGRKISGSAQYRIGDALLQHGTLLIDLDPEEWSCVIRGVDKDVLLDRVTSLRSLGIEASLEEVVEAVVQGFIGVVGGEDYFYGSLTPEEHGLADEVYQSKAEEVREVLAYMDG